MSNCFGLCIGNHYKKLGVPVGVTVRAHIRFVTVRCH